MLTAFLRLTRVALVLAVVAAATPAQAAPLLDVQSGAIFQRGTFTNFGYTVTFNQMVRIDALGLWDAFGNGLTDAHQVGIWDSGGALLAQAVVNNASTHVASLDPAHAWLYTSIAPLQLAPGTYKLGAYYPSSADFFLTSIDPPSAQVLVNPLATYGHSFFKDGGEFFAEPNSLSPASWDPGFFGPNAQVTAVPEPGTLALLGLGLAIACRRLKRIH